MGWWSPDTGGRGRCVVTSWHILHSVLSDLINTIIDGTVAPGCCQLKPDSPSYQISLLSNIYKSRSSRRSEDFTCGGGKSWNSEMKQTLSAASAWLCKRICNHNLPLYGLVMGNIASTYTHWVSLAFKIVLNFPRASRMPQVHAWESIIDQNDPSAAGRVRVTPRQFSSPPTFLLCNDSITSSRAITPPHMSPPPANQSPGWGDIDQSEARPGPGIISPGCSGSHHSRKFLIKHPQQESRSEIWHNPAPASLARAPGQLSRI